MGAARYDTVWPRSALFALADHASAARGLVHADGLGRRAACTAGRARLVLALGRRLGACGLGGRYAVRGRAHRLGDEAGLSCRSGPPPAGAVGACTGARARSFTRSVVVVAGFEPTVPAITKEHSDPWRRRCGSISARGRRDYSSRVEGPSPPSPPPPCMSGRGPRCRRRRRCRGDRKSTRLNSSHLVISYAVFCLKKKK